MTGRPRLADYLGHMLDAAQQAVAYVEGMDRAAFVADKRTQQAVILNLMILGEAASQVLAEQPTFADRFAAVPWHSIKGMRNRIAHGYFDIDIDVVWATVETALPDLLAQLPAIHAEALRDLPPTGEPPNANG